MNLSAFPDPPVSLLSEISLSNFPVLWTVSLSVRQDQACPDSRLPSVLWMRRSHREQRAESHWDSSAAQSHAALRHRRGIGTRGITQNLRQKDARVKYEVQEDGDSVFGTGLNTTFPQDHNQQGESQLWCINTSHE